MPVSLSSIQCFGALRRLRCFLGPRAMANLEELVPTGAASGSFQRSQRPKTLI
jgi:hypothetical protein